MKEGRKKIATTTTIFQDSDQSTAERKPRPPYVLMLFIQGPGGLSITLRFCFNFFYYFFDIADLPGSDSEVRDGVEVGAQHLGVAEVLVTEGVHAVQRDAQVSCRHPFLPRERDSHVTLGTSPAVT